MSNVPNVPKMSNVSIINILILLSINLPIVNTYLVPVVSEKLVNSPKLLFFTGGNSLMPSDIYSDFISKLNSKYDTSVIKNKYSNINKNKENIIEQLLEYSTESEIIPIGHSSGCTTLLNYCTKLKNIKKCILLDPVNNNLNNDLKGNKGNLNNFESVLQINAEKSYKWKMGKDSPIPQVPFIPAFSMDITNLFQNCESTEITKIKVENYGHCDILDTAFSNIMHSSFAEGNNDRNSLNKYRELLLYLIDNYINETSNSLDSKIIKEQFGIELSIE